MEIKPFNGINICHFCGDLVDGGYKVIVIDNNELKYVLLCYGCDGKKEIMKKIIKNYGIK